MTTLEIGIDSANEEVFLRVQSDSGSAVYPLLRDFFAKAFANGGLRTVNQGNPGGDTLDYKIFSQK